MRRFTLAGRVTAMKMRLAERAIRVRCDCADFSKRARLTRLNINLDLQPEIFADE